MSTIIEQKNRLVEYFAQATDWEEKYLLLIDLGRQIPSLLDSEKIESNRIKQCTSRLWIAGNCVDGKMYYRASSDSQIVAGLIAIPIMVFNGQSPQTILDSDLDWLKEFDLAEHILSTRLTGLEAGIQKIKQLAQQALNKS
jgi:cysteine desulfuration protein SufE